MTGTGETRALWITGPEEAEICVTQIAPGPDECVIETLFSGISRGTERLVFQNRVPASEHQTMRAPFQEGDFPTP